MIVISGVLLLVAVVCLVIGLFSSLAWVYISIAVSVVSFVFLLLGVRQRKDLPATAGPAATEPVGASRIRDALGTDDDVTVVSSRAQVPAPPAAQEVEPAGGTRSVLVVPGRPRYHADGCRYLSGRDAEVRTVAEARAEGYAPCGVCRPDDAPGGEVPPVAAPVSPAVDTEPTVALTPAAPTRPTRRPVPARAAAKAPAKAPAREPAKPATKPATRSATKAPAQAATVASAKAASRGETVVVIPDRDKYHREDCRYVRGVDGTQTISKARAKRDGFQPCGVCKP